MILRKTFKHKRRFHFSLRPLESVNQSVWCNDPKEYIFMCMKKFYQENLTMSWLCSERNSHKFHKFIHCDIRTPLTPLGKDTWNEVSGRQAIHDTLWHHTHTSNCTHDFFKSIYYYPHPHLKVTMLLIKQKCVRVTFGPLVCVWFRKNNSIPRVLVNPMGVVNSMSLHLYHESLLIPWVHVYTKSLCLYRESMSNL